MTEITRTYFSFEDSIFDYMDSIKPCDIIHPELESLFTFSVHSKAEEELNQWIGWRDDAMVDLVYQVVYRSKRTYTTDRFMEKVEAFYMRLPCDPKGLHILNVLQDIYMERRDDEGARVDDDYDDFFAHQEYYDNGHDDDDYDPDDDDRLPRCGRCGCEYEPDGWIGYCGRLCASDFPSDDSDVD